MIFLQANMNRSKTANHLLTQLTAEYDANVIIISEQYSNWRNDTWFSDVSGTAAIWIRNIAEFPILATGAGNGFVWVRSNKLTVVSCYLTPNESRAGFRVKVDDIEDAIQQLDGKILVAGDFNAKAPEWGMPASDMRGRYLLEMAARSGLIVLNNGSTPTFRRAGCTGTIPDITMATEDLASKIHNWKVIEDYCGSDHQYIVFDWREQPAGRIRSTLGKTGWNINKLNEERLMSRITAGASKLSAMHISLQGRDRAEGLTNATMKLIHEACKVAMPAKVRKNGNRTQAYWWTPEIAELRKACLRLRRLTQRARLRPNREALSLQHKAAKRNMRKAIEQSKAREWKTLIAEVDKDPWGLGYKLVTKKLGAKPATMSDSGTMVQIVDALFPHHPPRPPDDFEVRRDEIPLFTEAELRRAASILPNKKAPGPDGIPAEVIRVVARNRPDLLLDMYNTCLLEGVFPKRWKVQRLALIGKGKGDPTTPSAYRPLCMLDTTGKLLEKLLKPRLLKAVEDAGGLSDRQFGFRPGRSTLDAVRLVTELVDRAWQGNHHSRKIVLMATLDVRNAFNSASWKDIMNALDSRIHTPKYLVRMIGDYLRERTLIFETEEGIQNRLVTAGAAQGSVLGPNLWNILYDDILRIEMPDGACLVGYADDIVVVIMARTYEESQLILNQVMRRVIAWLTDHSLSLATHKTELVLVTRKRIPTQVTFIVDTERIETIRP